MSRERLSLAVLSLIALAASGHQTPAVGQVRGGETVSLFAVSTRSEQAIPSRYAARPGVGRRRVVELSPDALTAFQPRRATRGDALVLNLFDDRIYVAVMQQVAVNVVTRSRSWRGVIGSEQEGTVQLVVRGRRVSGHVMTDAGHFVIEPLGSGHHIVFRLEEETLPPEAEPLLPPPRASPAWVGDAPGPLADDGSLIDVMVVYTASARVARGGTAAAEAAIQAAVDWTNTAYTRSGISTQLRLVHTTEVGLTESTAGMETDLNRLTNTSDGFVDDVHTMRDTYGADLVALITQAAPYDYCGIAWYANYSASGSFPAYAGSYPTLGFSVTDGRCLPATFAHELGHNEGAAHDRYVTSTSPYAAGYGYVDTTNRFRTVMAYPTNCTALGISCSRIQNFSNPDGNFGGAPTGVSTASPSSADNRLTLNSSRVATANFRASVSTTVPSAPGSFSATVASGSQVDLAWADTDGEDGYQLWMRSVVSESWGSWSSPDIIAAGSTSTSVTGLTYDRTYQFQLRAYNSAGSSDPAYVTASTATPDAPTDLAGTAASSTQVDLSWTDGNTNESSYQYWTRYYNGGSWTSWSGPSTLGADSTSTSVTGLTYDRMYQFQVRVENAVGLSGPAYASVDTSTPTAPSSFTATTASSTQVDLGWTDESSAETSYQLWQRIFSGGSWGAWSGPTALAANATSTSVTGLTYDNQYQFQLRAENGVGSSDPAYASANTSVPDTPTSLVGEATSGTVITLNWPGDVSNADGFSLWQREYSGGWGAWGSETMIPANDASTTVTGLTFGSTYEFQLRAYNAVGSSGPLYVSVAIDVPPAPTNLSATTPSSTQADLTWSDGTTTETEFVLWRREFSGGAWGAWTAGESFAPNTVSTSVTGLTSGSMHQFQLRTGNNVGLSAPAYVTVVMP